MSRYFINLSYNGTHFHGWQIQPNAPTVQETLQKALSTILRTDIAITGCGRTDTGVHANYFMAHFNCKILPISLEQLQHKLNSFLPKSIAIASIFPVASDAHTRFDATERTYKYYISRIKNPFLTEQSYYLPFPLNFDKMQEASKVLLNYSDFTSFSKLHTDVKTNICKIKEAHWEQQGNLWIFTITADRFLRNMVRAIVGTLLMVGKGKCSIQEFCQIIEKKDRALAGSSAPPEGLFLYYVKYPYLVQGTIQQLITNK